MPNSSALVDRVLQAAKQLCQTARTAKKHGKSLSGESFYGTKFHEQKVTLARAESLLAAALDETKLEQPTKNTVRLYIASLCDEHSGLATKVAALKDLELMCETKVRSALEEPPNEPISASEPVLPFEVIRGTRGYLERIVTQANVCYETRCYDACSVMIRKLVELLIIAVYEAGGKAKDIKGSNGDFLMLSDLISRIQGDPQWNLARETKRSLPELKTLGDRSAHTRHYLAGQRDVDAILKGLRVCVDDLLHLAKLK